MDYLTPGLAKAKLLLAGAMAYTSLDGRFVYANYRGFCVEFPVDANGDILASQVRDFLTLCAACPRTELTEGDVPGRITL